MQVLDSGVGRTGELTEKKRTFGKLTGASEMTEIEIEQNLAGGHHMIRPRRWLLQSFAGPQSQEIFMEKCV